MGQVLISNDHDHIHEHKERLLGENPEQVDDRRAWNDRSNRDQVGEGNHGDTGRRKHRDEEADSHLGVREAAVESAHTGHDPHSNHDGEGFGRDTHHGGGYSHHVGVLGDHSRRQGMDGVLEIESGHDHGEDPVEYRRRR